MLTLMPAGAQPSNRLGCRMSGLHSNLSSNGLSLGRRCGHRAAFIGYRTSSSAALSLRARATRHPSSSGAGSAFQPAGLSNAFRARPSAPQRQCMRPLTRPRRDGSCFALAQGGSVAHRRLAVQVLLAVRRPTRLARWLPRRLGSQRHSAATKSPRTQCAPSRKPRQGFKKVARGKRGTSATPGKPRQEVSLPLLLILLRRRRGGRGRGGHTGTHRTTGRQEPWVALARRSQAR